MELFFVEFGAFDPTRFRKGLETLPLGRVEVERQVGGQVGEYSPVAGGLDEGLKLLLEEMKETHAIFDCRLQISDYRMKRQLNIGG